MAHNSLVKQITFPSQLIELAEERASQFGISIPEYVRHLVINDTMQTIELSKEDEKSILKGIEDYKAGRTTLVRSKEELKKFLDSLKTPNGKSLSRKIHKKIQS